MQVDRGNHNDDGRTAACVRRPSEPGMRRSCSECGRRKKSCDGQRPCGRCVGSGNRCSYTKRRWHLPQSHRDQPLPRSRDRNGADGSDLMLQPAPSGALATSGRLPFKRFRLSASPATGLVGMQESAFLSDFFGCVGFFPLTTQSEIRESMVNMMTTLQLSAVGGDFGEQGRFDAIVRGADWSEVSEGHQIPMNPSSCTFWCAIALGALVKGHPIESVTKYAQLAHEALGKSNSGPADAEVAKAWAILAYLHGWMGDLAKYQQYLALSESYVRSVRKHGSADALPVGFSEVVTYAEISDACCEQRQMKSLIAEEESIFQLSEAATEGEIYQHVAQSFKAFEQASHAIAKAQMCKTRETRGEAEGDRRSERVRPSDNPLLCMAAISNAMGTVLQSGRCIDFEPLEATVDRPSFGEGVGSLFINVALVFVKGVKGDLQASMERLRRCVEVYERYPGLCRGTMGHHKAHFVLICLAAIKDSRARVMYERLRSFYNSFRPADALPVPPFDEWHGVGAFCDYFYCRAVEGLVASEHMKDFSGSPVDRNDVGDRMNGTDSDEGKAAPLCDVNTRHERRSAGSIPQNIIDTDSDWPSESGADDATGSSVASTPPASPLFFHYPCCQSEARVHSDRFENSGRSVVVAPESLSRSLKMGEDAEDECIGAGNWLDVTHAMLDAL